EIRIDTPGPREVVVRTAATGVCHSDLHVLEGSLPSPLPTVLGHEPAGVVESVGSDVRHVAPGDHVIGCLSAFCGTCEYCVAGRTVAVDTVAWKVELAVRLGATDAVNAAAGNPVPEVLEMTAGGVDYAFEAIGTPATVRQAVRMTRKGGTIVMIGVVPAGTSVELPGADIVLREKTILGCMMGSNRFRIDMPRYVELYRGGLLHLDEMISARLPLERVNDAFEAMRRGM